MARSASRSSPQTELDWGENFDSMLDDEDGCELFSRYMAEAGLGHILDFRMAVVGFKLRMAALDDLEEYMKKEGNMIITMLWKRYFRHKNDHNRKMDCVPESIRTAVDHAVRQKEFSPNLYDQALEHVTHFLKTRCHQNFLKSDIFIEYIQLLGQQEETPLTPPPLPPKPSASVKTKEAVIPKEEAPASIPKELETFLPSLPNIPEDNYLPKVTADPKESFINANVALPSNNAPERGRVGSLTRPPKVLRNPGNLAYIPEHDLRTLPRGSGSSTMRKSGLRCYDMGFIDKMPPSNHAAPYHAMSSTVNIVTRQSSALQSVVTGGDTSDTYSSFSEDPVRREKKQYVAERRQMVSMAKTNKDRDNLRGPFAKVKLDENYITQTLAVNNPPEFAQMLTYKLTQLKLARRKDDEFKEMLRQNHTDRISNPSHSVVGENPVETDESILDDHVDQVFNKEEEASKLLSLSKSHRPQGDGRSIFSRVSTAAVPLQKSQQQHRISHYDQSNHSQGYSNHSTSTSSWSLNSLSRTSNHNHHIQNNNGYPHLIDGNWPQHKVGYTTAKIQRLDGEKYPIAINIPKRPPITLHDLKTHMPSKSGNYRYFFKIRDNTGQILYAEERENNAILPLFDGMIIVKVDH